MDEQNRTRRTVSEPARSVANSARADAPATQPASIDDTSYRRTSHHITQAPIDDIATEYVMPNRYTTVDQARAGRKHMGVATNDPEYLTPGNNSQHAARRNSPDGKGHTHPASLHYDRYLQTPKSGKAIFTSQQRRKRQRAQRIVPVAIVLLLALVLIWFIFLR